MAGLDGLKGLFNLNGSMTLCFNNILFAFDSHSLHTKSSSAAKGQQQDTDRSLEAVVLFLCFCLIKHRFSGIKFNIIIRFFN